MQCCNQKNFSWLVNFLGSSIDPTVSIKISADTLVSMIRSSRKAINIKLEAGSLISWVLRLTDPTVSIKTSADTLISMIRSSHKATMQRCNQTYKH